jgi:hypothetical protein
MNPSEAILPDLQAALLCEDVRQEINGSQTLVGVINVIPAPVVPIGLFKLCLWSRWCGGAGDFEQESLILGCENDEPLAKASVRFHLPGLDAHATNVHVFGGIQFPKHGHYPVEIRIDGQLRLRFLLPVVAVQHPNAS